MYLSILFIRYEKWYYRLTLAILRTFNSLYQIRHHGKHTSETVLLSILFIRYKISSLYNQYTRDGLSILFIRYWLFLSTGELEACYPLSILFIRYDTLANSFSMPKPVTFNSLYQILVPVEILVLIITYFQFSLSDTTVVCIVKVSTLLTFNSLYQILSKMGFKMGLFSLQLSILFIRYIGALR